LYWLEDKIRPPQCGSPWVRDVLGLAFLAALGVALLPVWGLDLSALASAARSDGPQRQLVREAARRFSGQISAWYLLPALGFALSLRRGAIDLSVWAVAGVGGVVAAAVLNAGMGPGWAFAAALGAGGALGAVNAALVAGARVPSILVTTATAVVLLWAAGTCVGERSIDLPARAFDDWHLTKVVLTGAKPVASQPGRGAARVELQTREIWLPLRVTRMLVVGVTYSLVVLVLLIFSATDIGTRDVAAGRKLFAALCASGMLAAVGGACWLLDHPQSAPVPTRLVDDLRIPAAALLAGAAFFGRCRAVLTALCLPGALLLATAWRQEVWHLQASGYALQLVLLAGMAVAVHIGLAHATARGTRSKPLAGAAAAVILAGLLVVAWAVNAQDHSQRRLYHSIGLGIWLAGTIALLVSRALSHRQPAPAAVPDDGPAAPDEREPPAETS